MRDSKPIADQESEVSELHTDKLAWLRRAWEIGIASGNVGELDFAELKREARERSEIKD